MTRMLRIRFRRLVIVGALGAGAVALAIGTAAAASASPTWGGPTPSPSPTTPIYTPPPQHHTPKPDCFVSLLTEHDALPAQFDQQGGSGYTDPAGAPSSAPVYGQQYGQPNGQPRDEREAVEVVQLVRVCVTEEHNKWGGSDDVVTVRDVSGPFAWVVPAEGYAPTPTGLPSSIAGMLTH